MDFFDSVQFEEEYGICQEEVVGEFELEEVEELSWDELMTK